MRRIPLLLVILMIGALLVPVQAQDTPAPISVGCLAVDQLTFTQTGAGVLSYGPQNFLAGEKVHFQMSTDDPDGTYSVNANANLVAETIAAGTSVTYVIPADGSYTFSMSIETSGTVTMTYTVLLDCQGLDEPDDPFAYGPPYPICHYPPGNPDNAHTITVGSMSAVQAHFAHGDTAGPCAENVESRLDAGGGTVVIFLGSSNTEIYGACSEGTCTLVALIDIQLLIELNGSQEEIEFDEDPDDEWYVIVYFLGFQDRDGDGEEVAVYQINIYVNDVLRDDNVLILIDSDGSFVWETNDDTTPDDGDDD